MKQKVIFISDYFLNEINGGAEFCNEALIDNFLNKKHEVLKVKSCNVNIELINNNKNCVFIIANYMQLQEQVKNILATENYKYIIYEHDHKYLKSNNPALYNNFLANEEQIQNLNFCKNAIAILCQSELHTKIVFKNTLLNNIINLGANVWTDEQLKILKSNITTQEQKTIENVILKSNNYNKGMLQTVEYCNSNKIEFSFLENSDYYNFISKLSKCKKLFFFPTWVETFSRFAIEAKILNCKIVTNNLLGCASEGLLNLNGIELLNEIKKRMLNI
jgi:hypothetical protein